MTIIRAGNIIGGGDWGYMRLVPDIYRSFEKRKKLIIRNPGAVRPWQHVLDVINGIILAIVNDKKFNDIAFNFGPQKKSQTTVSNFVKMMKHDSKLGQINYKISKKKFYENKILLLSSIKSKKFFGWGPRLDIKKSIKLTTDWFEDYYLNRNNAYRKTVNQIENFFKIE